MGHCGMHQGCGRSAKGRRDRGVVVNYSTAKRRQPQVLCGPEPAAAPDVMDDSDGSDSADDVSSGHGHMTHRVERLVDLRHARVRRPCGTRAEQQRDGETENSLECHTFSFVTSWPMIRPCNRL